MVVAEAVEAARAAGRTRRRAAGRRCGGVRILVAEPLGRGGAATGCAPNTRSTSGPNLTRDSFSLALPDYDALIVRSQVKVDAEALRAGQRLVVVGRAGVGVDNIDLDAATRAGVAGGQRADGQHGRGRGAHARR